MPSFRTLTPDLIATPLDTRIVFDPWANDLFFPDLFEDPEPITYEPGDTISQPENGTATIENGQIVYTPNAGFVGTEYLTYTSDTETSRIILQVGDAPADYGFILFGSEGQFSGSSVSSAGDFNNDGIDDLLIGARGELDGGGNNHRGIDYEGRTFVVYGRDDGYPTRIDLNALSASEGIIIEGLNAADNLGTAVSGLGDVNGDGIDDILINARSADPNGPGSGQNYVIFGGDDVGPDIDLDNLDGSNGFAINGLSSRQYTGVLSRSGGDLNGDGLGDIVLYTNQDFHVVFGSDQGFDAELEIRDLDGSNGFTFSGAAADFDTNRAAAIIGDVNDDGIDDFAAYVTETRNGQDSNETYVIFGSDTGFAASLNGADLDGSNGFTFHDNANANSNSLFTVSGSGDVNGDGIDDFLTTTPANTQVHVIFGSDTGFDADVNLGDLEDDEGFTIDGSDQLFGRSMAIVDDVNGDQIDDILIGATRGLNPDGVPSGKTYLIFGSDEGFDPLLDVEDLDGSNGMVFDGYHNNSRLGYSVSSAGDLNGDGVNDLLMSAYQDVISGEEDAGETYLIFGGDNLEDLDGSDGQTDGRISVERLHTMESTEPAPENNNPVATNDMDQTDEDVAVTINVLANDSDPDGDPLTVTAASAQNGSVVINGDQSLTYTPNADFFGSDSISYTIEDDNGGTANGMVDVDVAAVNDAPVAVDDTIELGADPVLIDVLQNDSDVDGDTLTITNVVARGGTADLNSNGILFQADDDPDTLPFLSYTISDGSAEDSAEVDFETEEDDDIGGAADMMGGGLMLFLLLAALMAPLLG